MRPKRTRKDENHAAVRDELRQDDTLLVGDVADLPGDPRHNTFDLVVVRLDARPVPVIVATSAAGVRQFMAHHPHVGAFLVEIKPDPTAQFTVSERLCLTRLGLWPPEVWI